MMKTILMALAATFAVHTTAAAAPRVAQLTRVEQLDPNVQVHTVEVVGWPGMTTAIKFTDSFEAVNVLCGQCTELSGTDGDDAKVSGEKRNWYIEKRVREQSIHVRPAIIPTKKVPASAFTTNIYVALNGGHAVNVALRLLHPDYLPIGAELGADAVVTVSLPNEASMSGKLAEERRKLETHFGTKTQQQSHKLMLDRLNQRVVCKDIRWRKPYRTDKAIVQLNQLCTSFGPTKSFWVTFDLENRGDAALYTGSATLEPEQETETTKKVQDPLRATINREVLSFGETAKGIAFCSLAEGSDVPSSWRLKVEPDSPGRRAIEIDQIVF